jgi:peptidyl-prolyl cis-trans isomerase A (cyclophilin A)
MNFLVNTILKFRGSLRNFSAVLVLLSSFFASQFSHAQTIVNVETNLGNFSIELFDSQAPATVANFLSYVTSDRYNGTFIHRVVKSFVVQGGFYFFDEPARQIGGINLDSPVINEFGISSTRGTLAMAKVGGDPNSATSQWFVNLADNSENLDNQNGGFTVFGRVIEPGMTVVDAISALPLFNINGVSDAIPLTDFTGGDVVIGNFINIQMSVSAPPGPVISNSFDEATGLLTLKVALDGAQFLGLSFSIDSLLPSVVIRGLLETVVAEPSGKASFTTFNSADGSLVIPQLYINGAVAFRNARFVLTDPEQFLFTLQSVE